LLYKVFSEYNYADEQEMMTIIAVNVSTKVVEKKNLKENQARTGFKPI